MERALQPEQVGAGRLHSHVTWQKVESAALREADSGRRKAMVQVMLVLLLCILCIESEGVGNAIIYFK